MKVSGGNGNGFGKASIMKSNDYDINSSLGDYTHSHSEVIEYLLILLTRLTEVGTFILIIDSRCRELAPRLIKPLMLDHKLSHSYLLSFIKTQCQTMISIKQV